MKGWIKCLALFVGLTLHVAALAQSTFVSMVPVRLMDTHQGGATVDGQGSGGGPVSSKDLQVLGRAGIPASGVSAVALNVTATDPGNFGYLVVWPTGTTQPLASNLNYVPGLSISNEVIAKIGTNGQVSIVSSGGSNIIVDVTGYFPTTSNLTPLTPARLMDTRTGATTVDGQYAGGGAIAPGATLDLAVLGRGGIPGTGVSAIVVNITATQPTGPSYITVWPSGTTQPNASNLNVSAGQTIANLVMVAPGANGKISIYNNYGSTQLIADVVGYFSSTTTFGSLVPARVLDTRPGMPTVDGQFSGQGALGSGSTLSFTVLNRGGVPSSGVGAVALNIIAVSPSAAGYLVAWGTGTTAGNAPPLAMGINFAASSTVPSLVIAQVGPNGQVSINNNSAGTTHVVADVVGWFPANPLAATFVSQNVPTSMTAGQTYPVSITMQNTGTTTWTEAQSFRLGSQNPQDNGTWNVGRVYLPSGASVAIGQTVTFNFNVTAPVTAGTYNFQWEMVQDGVAWFGDKSPNVAVAVAANPTSPSPPTSVTAAASGSSSITASWTLATGGATPTYLKIQRATSLSGPWTLVNGNYTPAASGQMSEVVSASGTYYYKVAACNSVGCSTDTVSNPGATVSVPPPTPTSDSPLTAATPATDPASDSVGATAAQFRVDEGGNATYSIPIQVPPGTAGVSPKLALSYNSRLPNGVMGPGWTIEGSSQISRCRQTRESGDFASSTPTPDGNPLPVNFTASDRFCLDGVRLLLLSGNTGAYGANGTTYSPETDPTTKVTVYVSGNYVGPDSFTVQRKDGTTSTYGYAASSPNALITAPNPANIQTTTTVSWNLARVQDSKGNYIDYIYDSRPSSSSLPFAAAAVETILVQVKYTGHATSPVSSPYASINFTYTPLLTNLVRIGYQGGVMFVQTQALACVTVTSGTTRPSSCGDTTITSSTLRYYKLGYQTSSSGSQFQQLSQIKECRDNSTSAVCFAPTTFNWAGASNTFVAGTQFQSQTSPNFGGNGVGIASSLAGYKVADIDGDGRQDFVWAVNDTLCNVNGNTRSSIYVGFLDRTATGEMTLTTSGQGKTCAPIDLKDNDRAWYLLDYDGDGRADLLIGGAGGSNWAIYSSLGRPSTSGAAVFGTTTFWQGSRLRLPFP